MLENIVKCSYWNKLSWLLTVLFVFVLFDILTLDHHFIDGWNIRQSQTAQFTQNIFYDLPHFLPTRLNFFAPNTGHVILEFPLVHIINATLSHFFGFSDRLLRFSSLFFYISSVFIFFKIVSSSPVKYPYLVTILFSTCPLVLVLSHAYMPEISTLCLYLYCSYLYLLILQKPTL